jgi:hypothetical protein
MTVTALPHRTVEQIVDGLKDHVWTLVCAQRVDAAMVLLEASLEDYLAAAAAAASQVEVLEGIVMDDEPDQDDEQVEPDHVDSRQAIERWRQRPALARLHH